MLVQGAAARTTRPPLWYVFKAHIWWYAFMAHILPAEPETHKIHMN